MGSLVDHVPHSARVDLQFQGGETSGKAACNSYGGSYEATSDGDVTFGQIASTAMACLDDDLMSLESGYLQTLQASTGFQVSEAGLVLTGGNVALTFTAGAATGA